MNQIDSKRVAIVTGASRGIGAQIARRLARDGFAVAVNYAASAKEADALVAELREAGSASIAVKADVARPDDVRRMFETVEAELGPVDALINNAGVLTTTPLADTSDALYDKTFGINVRGTFNTLREAAARMNGGGRIVNFSSTTLALNMPGYAIYNATKAAVESFTHVFAKELRGRGITVNAVAPGPIKSAMTTAFPDALKAAIQVGRMGTADDVAEAVKFLASDAASFITGEIVDVNGGMWGD